MSLHRRALVLPLLLAPAPAWTASDAMAIPPPPYVVQPVVVLLVFLAIFVGSAWSLSTLMGLSPRPIRLRLWKRRRG